MRPSLRRQDDAGAGTGPDSGSLAAGARAIAPVAVADFVDGIAFGAVALAVGLGYLAPIVFSLTTFSGSAQYATVTVLGQGGAALTAVLAAVALNARYVALAAAVAGRMTGSRRRKVAVSLFLTDATWALVSERQQRLPAQLVVGAGATEMIAWTAGTAVGVLVGRLAGDTSALGMDAALPALFMWMLIRQLGTRRAAGMAVVGGASAAALMPLLPAGTPVLVAGAVALLVARR